MQDAVDRGWLLDEASHFSGMLGLKKLLQTALELAKALAYLHRLDIMHGDLTGGNVMLTSAPVTQDDPRGFTVKVKFSSCLCLLSVLHKTRMWMSVADLPLHTLMFTVGSLCIWC